MRFIGSNDTSTLEGVIEELQRERRTFEQKSKGGTLKRDRDGARRVLQELDYLIHLFEDAAKHGPTPDLSKPRITIPEESRKALLGED